MFSNTVFTVFHTESETGEGESWMKSTGKGGGGSPQKILNQCAPTLQLRPRQGLHLIYSLKPGNRAIKKSQTIRFPVLNSLTVWFFCSVGSHVTLLRFQSRSEALSMTRLIYCFGTRRLQPERPSVPLRSCAWWWCTGVRWRWCLVCVDIPCAVLFNGYGSWD